MSGKTFLRKIDKATAKPEFQEWLGQMDAELEAFFQEDAPDGFPHSDPYSVQAATLVHEHLVDQFPTWESYWDNADLAQYRDRLLRYFGTAWIQLLEGTWRNVPAVEERTRPWEMGPAIGFPFFSLFTFPHDDIRLVLNRKDPSSFARIYKNKLGKYEKWVADGRPERK
ncbi:hypothetical protein NCCP2495_25570 [Dietzia sp. NCCP-2495]|uniref:hypothetical protein n=1 Tax=Dietzia sp. NCCP-2495 TaxID=2934675 RepID=UPI002231316A|nr:hypothetical protein [Dietzia sp. NCCP-2495]GLB64677.1 hypothetical protein NCCP2495_25570 [Dietzia sp. NCCP-2495]